MFLTPLKDLPNTRNEGLCTGSPLGLKVLDGPFSVTLPLGPPFAGLMVPTNGSSPVPVKSMIPASGPK